MVLLKALRMSLFGAVLIPALSISMAPSAEARGEGGSIAGSWSGGGVVVYSSGQRERTRCHASFSGGSTVIMSGTCATASGSATQSARLRRVGPNSYAGSFFNSQFNVSGSIYVTVHGNTQSVALRSSAGSANLSLRR